MKSTKDTISVQKHGVTFGISKGGNIGISIIDEKTKKQMNFQLDDIEKEEIFEWAGRSTEERERLIQLINSGTDRNEELRVNILELSKSVEEFIESVEKLKADLDRAHKAYHSNDLINFASSFEIVMMNMLNTLNHIPKLKLQFDI